MPTNKQIMRGTNKGLTIEEVRGIYGDDVADALSRRLKGSPSEAPHEPTFEQTLAAATSALGALGTGALREELVTEGPRTYAVTVETPTRAIAGVRPSGGFFMREADRFLFSDPEQPSGNLGALGAAARFILFGRIGDVPFASPDSADKIAARCREVLAEIRSRPAAAPVYVVEAEVAAAVQAERKRLTVLIEGAMTAMSSAVTLKEALATLAKLVEDINEGPR